MIHKFGRYPAEKCDFRLFLAQQAAFLMRPPRKNTKKTGQKTVYELQKRKTIVYYIGKWYSTKPLPGALRGPAKHDRSSI